MITLSIKGSAAATIKQLEGLPPNIDTALAAGLTKGLLYAASVAQRQYLSGPRPEKLDVITRRLRNSIATEVQADKTSGDIIGRIGSNVSYAAFHEFGFHGIVNVRAHSRVVSTLDVSGHPIDERRRTQPDKAGESFFLDTRAQAASKKGSQAAFVFTQNVRAHARELDYRGRPFVRPALEQSLPTITEEINKELKSL